MPEFDLNDMREARGHMYVRVLCTCTTLRVSDVNVNNLQIQTSDYFPNIKCIIFVIMKKSLRIHMHK